MADNKNQSLTIILTLKDRSIFTYRWMQYMNDIKCVYPILIADGGADQEVEEKLGNPESYPNLNYLYLRYPYDENLGTFFNKFRDVVEKVTTPYLLFADNDDFFKLDDTQTFIDFLDQNADYTSCGGDYVSLSLLTKQNRAVNAPKASNYLAQMYKNFRSVEHDVAVKRIVYFLENVENEMLWYSWYNIQRTSTIKSCFEILRHKPFAEVLAFELHFHFFLLTCGKYKQLHKTFYIRQEETSQSSSQLKIADSIFDRFVKNNTFGEIQTSLNFSNETLTEVEKDEIFNAFTKWLSGKASGNNSGSSRRSMIDELRRYLNETDSFRVFYWKKLLKQSKERYFKQDTRSYLRIPSIEKYIVEPVQLN